MEEAKPVILVQNLAHFFKNRPALVNITFAVQKQSIHGFVGPNGAGKTTTLKILATLLKPHRGAAHVFGCNIATEYKHVRRRIGFMPDHISMYRQMTVFEYLDFFAAAYGLSLRERDKIINDVLNLTDMDVRRNDVIKNLSAGMLQRLSLARVLVHDPDLLLLDEPAAGLDPRARIELMEILKELCQLGKTILISSHILAELGDLCDSVTIIDRGEVKYSGSMEGLLHKEGETVTYVLILAEEHAESAQALQKCEGVTEVGKLQEKPNYFVSFNRSQTTPNAILETVLRCGGQVVSFQEKVMRLSQAFMDLTKPGVPK